MDLLTAAVAAGAFALGGLFNAVVGVATAEYRARQDEGRRHRIETRDRVRAERLEQLADVKRYTYGELIYRMAVLSGDRRLADRSRVAERDLLEEWPRYDLIGDEQLLADYFGFVQELEARPAGSRFSEEDFRAWGKIEARLLREFMEQRERILRDEDTPLIPWDRVGEAEGGYEKALHRRRGGGDRIVRDSVPTDQNRRSDPPRTDDGPRS